MIQTSPPASSAGATLTSGAAHGFSVGDVVKYTKGGTVVTGLTDGAFYRVSSVASTTTMTLTTTDGEDVTYGGGGGHTGDTFTKVNTIDVKTVSKSNTTGLLVDGGITTLGTATTDDSMAIAGQVSLSSHKAFTVTPGDC